MQFRYIWVYDFNSKYGIITLARYHDEVMQRGEWL